MNVRHFAAIALLLVSASALEAQFTDQGTYSTTTDKIVVGGTSAPTKQLEVFGESSFSGLVSITELMVTNPTNAQRGRIQMAVPEWVGLTLNTRFDGANWPLDVSTRPGWIAKLDGRNGFDVFQIMRQAPSGGALATLFTVNSLGYAGVQTANPQYQLHVVNDNAPAEMTVQGSGAMGDTGIRIIADRAWRLGTNLAGTGSGKFSIMDATSAKQRLVIDTDGRVGIGTTAPTSGFHLYNILGNTTAMMVESRPPDATTQGIATIALGSRGDFGGSYNYKFTTVPAAGGFGVPPNALDLYEYTDNPNDNCCKGRLSIRPAKGVFLPKILTIDGAGNVGIGVVPGATLHVNGTARIESDLTVVGNISAKYQDVAEWVVTAEPITAGTVVIVAPDRIDEVTASTVAYDTRIAGVVSAQPGLILGEAGDSKVKVATTGRVRVRVDATRAPIHAGDLLVSSGKAGVAMKSEPVEFAGIRMHRPGTVVGKALESLESGEGEILVLLSLQ